MGRFEPADFSQGDPNTIGGYRAVHARPAAFEGADGASYSVEIVCDATGEEDRTYAAYLLFVRWREGDPVASGHLETDYIGFGWSEDDAIAQVSALTLQEARTHLDELVLRRQADTPSGGNGEPR